MSKSQIDELEIVLHKYFLHADKMRYFFFKEVSDLDIDENYPLDASIYLFLWYGCLYVVIEGWKNFGFSDSLVDSILEEKEKVNLLGGVRNDIFHPQKSYLPSRSLKMLRSQAFVQWVRQVHKNLGIALIRKLNEKNRGVAASL